MADHSKPVVTSTYTNFVTELDARFDDLALGLDPAVTTATNVPTNSVRWNSASFKWQKWNGTSWLDLSSRYSIAVDGTVGATTPSTGAFTTVVATTSLSTPTVTYAGALALAATGTNVITLSTNGVVRATVDSTGALNVSNLTASKVLFSDASKNLTSTGTVAIDQGGTGAVTAATALVALGERTGVTGSTLLPSGTTAQRDGTPSAGYIRFNTSLTKFEGYTGSVWGAIGGGATGGGSDEIFIENSKTVTVSYTLPATKNAMSTGPITINSGVIVTISDDSRWVIL